MSAAMEGRPRRTWPGTEAQVAAFLKKQPLLAQLPADAILAIARALEWKEYAPGDYLVREGEEGEGLYFIWQGTAAVPPKSENAGERPTNILQDGDFFGSVRQGQRAALHKADVIAITQVVAAVLPHIGGHLPGVALPWKGDGGGGGEGEEFRDEGVMRRILHLETLEVDLYRAGVLTSFYPRVFGGQLLGQALAAACKSMGKHLMVHSLHSYFLVAGDVTLPIVYRVERIRDGQSFATRHVVAVQKGRNIFSMHASFQKVEQGLEHQVDMPTACNPDQVPTWESLQVQYHSDPRIPLSERRKYAGKRPARLPVELRFCDPVDRVEPGKRDPRCALAYASDFSFLEVALLPHGIAVPNPNMVMASLDHCMWFHRPFRVDEWLLYEVSSPRSSGSSGLCLGRLYTRSGELVVSVAQEGLIRVANRPPAKANQSASAAPVAFQDDGVSTLMSREAFQGGVWARL
eukprot:jgi/Mesen1/10543/ME000083S10051